MNRWTSPCNCWSAKRGQPAFRTGFAYSKRVSPSSSESSRLDSVRQQNSQISQVVSRGAGHNRVTQRVKKGVSIKVAEAVLGIQAAGSRSFDGRAIRNRAGRGAVSIDSITTRAEHGDA